MNTSNPFVMRTSAPSPFVQRPVRLAFVEYIGHIWQPGVGPCAQRHELSDYDLGNIGEFTRDDVEHWLMLNSGDFSEIIDFSATCGDVTIPWADEESELTYNDCLYGDED